MSDNPETPQPRGVHNPRVVDLITKDAEKGEVVLVMLEERPWGADPEQLLQIQEKFNAYLGYIQGQYLAREYPEYAGLLVRIRLDCAESPREQDHPFLNAMRNFCEGEGIHFEVGVIR